MDQPEVKVYILHLRDRILALHTVIQRLCHPLDPRRASFFQKLVCLPLRKDIGGIRKIPFLQCLAVAHQKASALHPARQAVLRKFSKGTPDRHGNPVEGRMLQRFTVNVIPAEQLV